MLENVGNWLVTVPLDNPWRAIVLVGLVITFAFTLHILWEFGFTLAGRLQRIIIRFGAGRSAHRQRIEQHEFVRSR